ncbi:MAG: hypothetical protein KAJ09_12985 [Deltaproteobacteria bacterium]|nr:hypothetical protein [Deltaproteobacteria bacterium]
MTIDHDEFAHVPRNERKDETGKEPLAIFLGLLERTTKQRVMFMVKAKAEGKARIFMELITPKRLIAHDCGHKRIDTISYVKKGKRSTAGPFPIISSRSMRCHPESSKPLTGNLGEYNMRAHGGDYP